MHPPGPSGCQRGGLWQFGQHTAGHLVGKSVRNSAEFHNQSNSGPFELQIFHWIFIFLTVKCVPTNSEHISSSLESSPTINSSDFMNQKTYPPSVYFSPARKISSHVSQPVDPTMHICVDVCTIPGKAILLTIIYHLLNLDRRFFWAK